MPDEGNLDPPAHSYIMKDILISLVQQRWVRSYREY